MPRPKLAVTAVQVSIKVEVRILGAKVRYFEWPRGKLRQNGCEEEGVKEGLWMKVGDCKGSGMGVRAC